MSSVKALNCEPSSRAADYFGTHLSMLLDAALHMVHSLEFSSHPPLQPGNITNAYIHFSSHTWTQVAMVCSNPLHKLCDWSMYAAAPPILLLQPSADASESLH